MLELGQSPLTRTHGAEVLTTHAISHVELVSDDGKPHRMSTEEQPAILNRGVAGIIVRDGFSPTAVPTAAVERLAWIHVASGLARCVSRLVMQGVVCVRSLQDPT